MKRIVTATFLGIIFGVVCTQLYQQGGNELTFSLFISVLLSRALLGFAIGISKLKMKWWAHGILLGLLFSLPIAFNAFSDSFQNSILLFLGHIFAGIIYGFLIELITTAVFKMKNYEETAVPENSQ